MRMTTLPIELFRNTMINTSTRSVLQYVYNWLNDVLVITTVVVSVVTEVIVVAEAHGTAIILVKDLVQMEIDGKVSDEEAAVVAFEVVVAATVVIHFKIAVIAIDPIEVVAAVAVNTVVPAVAVVVHPIMLPIEKKANEIERKRFQS